jgi:hypothetical protein
MARDGRYRSGMRTSRKPDDVATFWRRYKATPIGAPADGLCAGCDRAIFRGDTVRINKELHVVHWDCWHRDLSWRSGVSDDLSRPEATVLDGASTEPEAFDH